MDSKINWYKEVLALEPGSKLFFPLAQLYAESGQYVEALEVLTQGLDTHPEFLEALLFQVEILSNLDRDDEAQELAASLVKRLTAYPAFWREWSKLAMKTEQDRDLALALNFLAAAFKGSPIGWAEIMDRGLKALLAEHDPDADDRVRGEMREAMDEMMAQVSRNELLRPDKLAVPAETASSDEEQDSEDQEDTPVDTGAAESYSLRTRSMAELLARQGDYDGAMDIYQELVEKASDDDAREDLRVRLVELKTRVEQEVADDEATAQPGESDDQTDGDGEESDSQGKKRLLDTLETLAQRLEARASS